MIIQRISRIISNYEMIMPLFAGAVTILFVIAIFSLPLPYYEEQLYPKTIDPASPLNPYDRGGPPFTQVDIKDQYPENSPTAGYVTYLSHPALMVHGQFDPVSWHDHRRSSRGNSRRNPLQYTGTRHGG